MRRRKHEEGDTWRSSRAKLNELCNQIRGVSRKNPKCGKGESRRPVPYVKNEDLMKKIIKGNSIGGQESGI